MKRTMLTQFRAPGLVVGLTNFQTMKQCMDFVEIFSVFLDSSYIYFARFDPHLPKMLTQSGVSAPPPPPHLTGEKHEV